MAFLPFWKAFEIALPVPAIGACAAWKLLPVAAKLLLASITCLFNFCCASDAFSICSIDTHLSFVFPYFGQHYQDA